MGSKKKHQKKNDSFVMPDVREFVQSPYLTAIECLTIYRRNEILKRGRIVCTRVSICRLVARFLGICECFRCLCVYEYVYVIANALKGWNAYSWCESLACSFGSVRIGQTWVVKENNKKRERKRKTQSSDEEDDEVVVTQCSSKAERIRSQCVWVSEWKSAIDTSTYTQWHKP